MLHVCNQTSLALLIRVTRSGRRTSSAGSAHGTGQSVQKRTSKYKLERISEKKAAQLVADRERLGLHIRDLTLQLNSCLAMAGEQQGNKAAALALQQAALELLDDEETRAPTRDSSCLPAVREFIAPGASM